MEEPRADPGDDPVDLPNKSQGCALFGLESFRVN